MPKFSRPITKVGSIATIHRTMLRGKRGQSRDGKEIQEGKFYGFKLRDSFSFWAPRKDGAPENHGVS